MKVKISYKNVKHSQDVEDYVKNKSEKIEKFVHGKARVEWFCSQKSDKTYLVEAEISGPHYKYHASSKHENFYKAIDNSANKLNKQVSKKIEKQKNHLHRSGGTKEIQIMDPDMAWTDYDEEKDKAS